MKIFFVGIHNKPNTKPLDSSTKSGKLIDQIISKLNHESIKTNLFDTDHIPKEELERQKHYQAWIKTHNPHKEDTIILLGSNVHKFFPIIQSKVIKIKHPSAIWSNKAKENYINETLSSINH